MELNFGRVEGLPPEEQQWLQELKYIYDYHRSANRKKRRYYNGKVTLNEVNLGIALPAGLVSMRSGLMEKARLQDMIRISIWRSIRQQAVTSMPCAG